MIDTDHHSLAGKIPIADVAVFLDTKRIGQEQSDPGANKASLSLTLIRTKVAITFIVHGSERGDEFIDIHPGGCPKEDIP